MDRLCFRVSSLLFEHSPVGLRRQLEHRDGIQGVLADPRTSTATVTFDPDRLARDDVERLISECGYECRCLDGAESEGSADCQGCDSAAATGQVVVGGGP